MIRDERFMRELPQAPRLCVQLRRHQQVLLLPRLPGPSETDRPARQRFIGCILTMHQARSWPYAPAGLSLFLQSDQGN